MRFRKLGYALGIEISGIDLREDLPETAIREIQRAWHENIVVCFPSQDLAPQRQLAFCSRFGTLDDHRDRVRMRRPDYPSMTMIANKPLNLDGKAIATTMADRWHTDLAYRERPTTATFLHARALPPVGGDTMFANMYRAYETLSEAMQALIDPLEAVHDVRLTPDFPRQSAETQEQRLLENPLVAHRVVRIHPDTGRKALYVGAYVRRFIGMSEEESSPLLSFLNGHATRYEFVYRHRWSLGDFIMWDNRCALHYAVPDYDSAELRTMQRCSLLGDRTGSIVEDATVVRP